MSNKKRNMILVFTVLFGGLAITAGTYFIKSDTQKLLCWPEPANPEPKVGDIVGGRPAPFKEQSVSAIRGFPKWFYKDAVPANCPLNANSDANTSSKFQLSAAIYDFAVWGFPLAAVTGGIMLVRNRGKHE